MKIHLDEHACVASGQCVLAAPAVFDQDDEGIAVVLQEDPGPGEYDSVREAALVCPAAAIRLEGDR